MLYLIKNGSWIDKMLKVRLTYVATKQGEKELEEMIKKLETDFKILSKSKPYMGRNNSKYANIYLDVAPLMEEE